MKKSVLGVILLWGLFAIGATADIRSLINSAVISGSVTATPAEQAQPFINQGKVYLQAHNILAARNQFSQALAVDPNNQEANLLFGIVRIFSVVEDGQSLNTSGLDSMREILELSGAVIQNFNIYGSTMQMDKVPASTTPRTGAVLDFLKNKALLEVDGAIANLLKVTNPAIISVIAPASIAQSSGSNISIDYADVVVVKSLLYALKCNLELLMVYGLDVSIPSIYDNPDQLMTYKALFQQDATFLTPKDPARLDTAKTALINFIDTYTNSAVPRLNGRLGSGHHLFVVDAPVGNEPGSLTSSGLSDITSKLAEVKSSLSGSHLFSFVKDQERNRTVNLSKFFNSAAPINIRSSLTNCAPGTVFPDPTFNGLFPLGIDGYQQFVAKNSGDLLGVACTGRETPAIKISQDQYWLADYSGNSSGPQVVTISNYGTAPLNVASISLGGANPGNFTLAAGTCSSLAPTLAAGTSCSVVVDLKRPIVSTGSIMAMLQISSDDLSTPVTSTQIYGYVNPSTGGSISGIVRDATTGEGMQIGWVSIYDSQTNGFIRSISTNNTGGYTFNSLVAGSYKLYFNAGPSYQGQWYSNKFSQDSANVVTLTANENKTSVNMNLSPSALPATLSVTITGEGNVNSDTGTPGIHGASPGVYTSPYAGFTPVTLTATTQTGWNFSGWTGACTPSLLTCFLMMDAPTKNVTATFTEQQNIKNGSAYHGTIAKAFLPASVKNNDILFIKSLTFAETPEIVYNVPGVSITLKGGYIDSGFLNNSGANSIVDGSLKIRGGAVHVQKITVK